MEHLAPSSAAAPCLEVHGSTSGQPRARIRRFNGHLVIMLDVTPTANIIGLSPRDPNLSKVHASNRSALLSSDQLIRRTLRSVPGSDAEDFEMIFEEQKNAPQVKKASNE